MKTITMKFSDKWIYGGDGTNSMKLKRFYAELSTSLGKTAKVTEEFVGRYIIEPQEGADCQKIINTVLSVSDKQLPGIDGDVVEIKIDDEPAGLDSEPAEKEKSKSTLDTINDLIGLDDFKKYCSETAGTAELFKNNKKLFLGEALLCAANDGNGFDENLSLFADFLNENGLIGSKRYDICDFGSYFDKPENRPDIKVSNSQSKLYVFDIRGWIGYTKDPYFKGCLKYIADNNDENLIVFRMGNRSKTVIEETIKDIEDIIDVRFINYPEFTDEQLYAYAEKEFDAMGFKPDEGTAAVFREIVEYEKEDGLFYGMNTVKKIAGEMARVSVRAGSGNTINSEACRSIVPARGNVEDSFKSFDDMIGMEDVARRMREIITQVMFSRAGGKKAPSMHMMFVGNPGTGKTTVARVLGQIYKENRVLRAGKFFEHKGRDLCGEYIGHTAVKVNKICQAAYGSILFIDEAYSLATDRDDKDYGKEAIDTLIAEMENHSDELVVIFAGYPDEMERLLDTNPGMRSRIPYTITFPDYSKEQLHRIFMKMVEKNNFTVTEDFSQHVKDYFLALPDELIKSKQFGNARFVRNVFERTWGKAILRCPEGSYEVPPLAPEDFDAAVPEFKTDESGTKAKKIGFVFD